MASHVFHPQHRFLPSLLSFSRIFSVIFAFLLVLSIGLPSQKLLAQQWSELTTIDLSMADPVNSNPYGLAAHPTLPLLYVALAGIPAFADPELSNGSTVIELDMETHTVLRAFSVGLFPTDLVVSEDGTELWVTTSTGGSVARVLLGSGTVDVFPLLDTGGGAVSFPSSLQFSADSSQVWVTSNGGGFDGSNENLIIVDRATGAMVDAVEIAGGLGRFVVRADGLAIVGVGNPEDVFPSQPELRIYDTANNWALLQTFELSVDTADFPAPVDVALSTDGLLAYVSVLGGSDEIFVVDLSTMALLPSIVLPGGDFYQHGLLVQGQYLYVTDFIAAQLRVVDLQSSLVVATHALGSNPNDILQVGGRLYVSNQNGPSLSVLVDDQSFRRGNTNGDESIDLSDGVSILNYLFSQGSLSCLDAADTNDDGSIDISDSILLFNYLFSSGVAPAYPSLQLGADLTTDSLGCVN